MTPPSAEEKDVLEHLRHRLSQLETDYRDNWPRWTNRDWVPVPVHILIDALRAAESAARQEYEAEDRAAWVVLRANGVPTDFDGSTAEAIEIALDATRQAERERCCRAVCYGCANCSPEEFLASPPHPKWGWCLAQLIRTGGEKEST